MKSRHLLGRFGIVAASIAVTLLAVDPAAAAANTEPQPSFFDTQEIRSSNLKPFKKWRDALKKFSAEKNLRAKACAKGGLQICSYDDWMKFLAALKDKDKLTQIKAVNDKMNKAKYITDNTNWGQKDYWASPAEFMERFGDCEDFAIVKYLSLRFLGFKEKELRVVAVKDLNLKIGHAVLIVFYVHPKNGKTYTLLLDNQIKKVVDAAKVRHYKPVFSINKNFWWRHVG